MVANRFFAGLWEARAPMVHATRLCADTVESNAILHHSDGERPA